MLVAALILMFCGLAAGTFATELTTGLGLGLALLVGDRRQMREPASALGVLGLALLLAAVQGAVVQGGGRDEVLAGLREVPGRLWPLAPLLVVPALTGARLRRVEEAGLAAAAAVGVAAVVQRLVSGEPEVAGPFSHHLTLGYALVVPLIVAVHRRRWAWALGSGAGILAAGGAGPVLAAAIGVLGATVLAPLPALGVGVVASLGGIRALQGTDELHQRVVLWESGAWLGLDRPLGVGPASARPPLAQVQQVLEPGFHFPLHAHDSSLQLAVLAGMGSWVALAFVVLWMWRGTGRAGRAAIAALAVGSLTQDVLGDLEVVRALAAWVAWAALDGATPGGGACPEARSGEPVGVGSVPAPVTPVTPVTSGGSESSCS